MTIRTTLLAATASVGACASVGYFLLGDAAGSATLQAPLTQHGLVTVIDQDSGVLRAPTADEAARYATPDRATRPEPDVLLRADGSQSMRLDERYTIFSVVTRNADGSWQRQCGLDHDHAAHATNAASGVTARAVR